MEKEERKVVIDQFKNHDSDTGSTEVQVALLTRRITELTEHMKAHRHDYHAQRGLMRLVHRRKKLLVYLSREDKGRYRSMVSELGLRK